VFRATLVARQAARKPDFATPRACARRDLLRRRAFSPQNRDKRREESMDALNSMT
jgi:hypothetical protein